MTAKNEQSHHTYQLGTAPPLVQDVSDKLLEGGILGDYLSSPVEALEVVDDVSDSEMHFHLPAAKFFGQPFSQLRPDLWYRRLGLGSLSPVHFHDCLAHSVVIRTAKC